MLFVEQPYSSPILLTSSSEKALLYLSNPSSPWQRSQHSLQNPPDVVISMEPVQGLHEWLLGVQMLCRHTESAGCAVRWQNSAELPTEPSAYAGKLYADLAVWKPPRIVKIAVFQIFVDSQVKYRIWYFNEKLSLFSLSSLTTILSCVRSSPVISSRCFPYGA